MLSRRVLALGFAGLISFAIAACGSTGSTGSPGTAVTDGAIGSGSPSTVAVEVNDGAFTPSTITVPAGSVTFSVKNVGSIEHEFEIFKGDQVVDEVEGLVPGLARDLTVTLEPGQYTYECKLSGHEESGTLTVTD
jgi:iron uptake system component EfeO